jgi:hypothetical protein
LLRCGFVLWEPKFRGAKRTLELFIGFRLANFKQRETFAVISHSLRAWKPGGTFRALHNFESSMGCFTDAGQKK